MRKTAVVTISDEGRDKNKIFILREAPAAAAERWATRATLALARSGVELPANVEGAGWAGLAMLGFQALAKAHFEELQPLLDEMWQYVSIRPDSRQPEVVRQLTWGDANGEGADIEEVATIFKLRMEVFSLHSGFSLPGATQTSSVLTTSTPGDLPSTTTSQPHIAAPLRRSSPPGKRRS